MSERPEEDTFTILLATDIHLGYEEKDRTLANDSFNSFEEILQIARDKDVDFILLGGDLFHIAKPSTDSIHRCMALLREHCMGDRPVSFEFLSDQEKNFLNTTQNVVNYEDPNINVSIPVFSIHGNHDDPVGQNNICSLDILSCAGLVNYFGKNLDLTSIKVSPLLLKKGETLLSIYGLSHVRDKRLYRLFEDEKVTFERPSEYTDDWFNICVLHQNRAARGVKEYIPEDQLPEFMDLIVWGHEHDCRIEPEESPQGHYHITQPGSSVATSLSEGEAKPKHVGLLKVYKKEFRLEPIPLQTVRPFVFREICSSEMDLSTEDMRSPGEQLEEMAENIINEMLQDAKQKLTRHPKQPKEPLIRLRLFYTDEEQMFNFVRLSQKFEERVANPSNLILMKKRFQMKEKRDVLDKDALKRLAEEMEDRPDVRVQDFVKMYFQDQQRRGNDTHSLKVLSITGLNEAVTAFVDKNHTEALEEITKYQTSRMTDHLLTVEINDDNVVDEMVKFNSTRGQNPNAETMEIRTQLQQRRSNGNRLNESDDDNNIEEGDADEEGREDEPVEETRTRGRGGVTRNPGAARAARAPRSSRAGRGSSTTRGSRAASRAATSTTRASGRGRGRGRGTPQRTLQESFANASQISISRTSARASANQSRLQYIDSDED